MKQTTVQTPTSRFRAGLAWADITPPVGIYHRFWGAAKHDTATGVHRPLRTSVLITEPIDGAQANDRQILVAVDQCLFRPPEMSEFRARLIERLGVNSEQITVVFSHTHSASHLSRDRSSLPGGDLIGPYLDSLPESVGNAYEEAGGRMVDVTATYASAQCHMGHQRDAWDEPNDIFVCGFNPDVELRLPTRVVRLTTDDGTICGSLVSYPCHPTTLAWDNTLISPDYVGALRETVESATDAPCMFLLAPCGDVGPRFGFVGDTEVADRNGRQVGFAALQALESMPPAGHDYHYVGPVISGATLGEWEYRTQTDVRSTGTTKFESVRFEVPLDYRPELPTVAEAEAEMSQLEADEAAARERDDGSEAARLRAMVERNRRRLECLRPLPADSFPYPVTIWWLGDAIWVAVDGEPYFELQEELTRRFPDLPLIVMPLSDGAMSGYLPTRRASDKPLYQVSISLLAPGSLEAIIEAISERIWG